MKITKFEQSGFIIESDSGFKLALDIGAYTPVEKLKGISPEAMLVSHIHGDHFTLEQIKALAPKTLYLNRECRDALGEEQLPFTVAEVTVGDSIDIGDFHVHFFNVDHGPNVSAPLQENFGFLISVDNTNIYFAGDMFYASGIEVVDLEVDYALLPVGGHYTFDPAAAFDFAKQFKKIGKVISMHYEMDHSKQGDFLKLAQGVFDAE